MPSKKLRFIIGLTALAALIAAVYGPVRNFDFVCWDDDNNFIQNPLLSAPWSWTLIKQLFAADQALRFEPVHWLVCRLLYAAAGLDPGIWHLLGLFWHLIAASLFAIALRALFTRIDPQDGLRAGMIALIGAALWALHPLRAETVGWATASTYPLTGACLLGSFVCYLRAYESGRRHNGWLGLAWALAVLGYGSYPVGVGYGLWLVGFDLWLLHRGFSEEGPRQPRWWIKHLMFILPAGAAVAVTVWTRHAAPGIFVAAPDLAAVGVPLRLVMAMGNLMALAWGAVWPVELSPNRIPLDLASARMLALVLTAAAAAATALMLAWKVRRTRPGLTLVILGFAALSIPCLGLTERPTWPVDRYSYLVHLVLIGGVATWVFGRKGLRPALITAFGAGLIVVAAAAARRQMTIWRDTETLFTHMEREPRFADNPRQQGHVYILWGQHLARNDSPERAMEKFQRANEIYHAAIRAAVEREDYAEALALSTHIGHHFNYTPVLHRERGVWLLRLGRKPEASVELQLALAAMPEDARTRFYLAEAQK